MSWCNARCPDLDNTQVAGVAVLRIVKVGGIFYGAEKGRTWLMTGTAAVFWRFEGEELGIPYLVLRASAATPQSRAGKGSRFFTRGM